MIKKFEDLVFEPHHFGVGECSKMFFPNGYGVSVVRFKLPSGGGSYTSSDNDWEVAILIGDQQHWDLCYITELTDDVLRWQSDEDVTNIMKHLQRLPMVEYKLN